MTNVEKYRRMRLTLGISKSDIEQELEDMKENSPSNVSKTEWLEDACGCEIALAHKVTEPSDPPYPCLSS